MVVTSAQYVVSIFDSAVNDHIEAVIDGETLQVPINPNNRHYQAILDWVADGNTIQDAD